VIAESKGKTRSGIKKSGGSQPMQRMTQRVFTFLLLFNLFPMLS